MPSKSRVGGVLKAPRRWPVTVEAYHQMIEANVFPPDARIELITGELIEMPPMHSRHRAALMFLHRLFAALAADGRLMIQIPVALSDSEPEPDLAVLAPGTPLGENRGDQVVLLIEIADATRLFDLQRKAPLYQQHQILETWVLDIPQQRLVVFPREGGSIVYPRRQAARITPRGVPEVTLELDALFDALPTP
jgi:Uma2 family endonuclease